MMLEITSLDVCQSARREGVNYCPGLGELARSIDFTR